MSVTRISQELGKSDIFKAKDKEKLIAPAKQLLELKNNKLKELKSAIVIQGHKLGKVRKILANSKEEFNYEFHSTFQVEHRNVGIEKSNYRNLCKERTKIKADIKDLQRWLLERERESYTAQELEDYYRTPKQ